MRVGIFVPWRHREYRLLAGGALTSLLGDGLFIVALPLLVYGLSNVPTAMAVVGIVWTGSQLLLLLVGGWASDRFPRRRMMVVADLIRAAAIGGIGLLAVLDSLVLWHVMVLGAFVGAGNAFFNPAATAIVPELVPEAELPQANAFLSVARPLMSRLVGPALGGLVVFAWGPGVAFLLDAATFLLSAALLSAIRRHPAQLGAPVVASARALREGFGFVRSQPWCWAWLLAAAFGLLAVTGPVDMLLPYVLRNDMGLGQDRAALAFGAILGFGGLGSVVMSVGVGQRGLPRRFVTGMYVAEALGVGMLAVYGLMTAVWHAVVAALFLNAMFAYTDIAWTTMLQRLVPRHLLGRVSSLDWLTSLGLIPLSFAIAGPLATQFGSRTVLVAGAAAGVAVIGALFALVPSVREPEVSPPSMV